MAAPRLGAAYFSAWVFDFITTGFRLFAEKGHTMALAAVTALLLGCRASEVVHLHVRDLDCGGTRLWIAAQDGEYRDWGSGRQNFYCPIAYRE